MPLGAIISLAAAFLELVNTLCKKLLPEKHLPTFRKAAQRVLPKETTISEIAEMGRKWNS